MPPETAPKLAFWFEFASTYSYLSAMTIETAAADKGVAVEWRPFLLGPIFKAQGWTTSPFNLYPAKGRNMWIDMERQCEKLGLPLVQPDPFPQNSLRAARIAQAGLRADWLPDFVRAVYAAGFGEGRDISDESLLAGILLDCGAPARDVLSEAGSQNVKDGLKEAVAEAARLDVFGAPSFVTPSGDLYWGHDRLGDALDAVR